MFARYRHLWQRFFHSPNWFLNQKVRLRPAVLLELGGPSETCAAGTMFELVKALNDGAEALRTHIPNPIGLNAGSELFIAFVTLFPHESAVSRSERARIYMR